MTPEQQRRCEALLDTVDIARERGRVVLDIEGSFQSNGRRTVLTRLAGGVSFDGRAVSLQQLEAVASEVRASRRSSRSSDSRPWTTFSSRSFFLNQARIFSFAWLVRTRLSQSRDGPADSTFEVKISQVSPLFTTW